MYISARERQIIEVLFDHLNGITIKEISQVIDVSERTIHRDLKGVEDVLGEFGIRLVKQSGLGLSLITEEEQLLELKRYLFQLGRDEYTPDERKVLLISRLLELREPVKLFSLASELNVTVATISADLSKVSDWLKNFQVDVIRKRGSGIELRGSEQSKRRAMSRLLMEQVNQDDFFQMVHGETYESTMNTVSERLLHLVDREKLRVVERGVSTIRAELPYSMADTAHIGLVIHLTLAIERIRLGEEIKMEDNYLEKLLETPEFPLAKKLAERLGQQVNLVIPQSEIGYITMHLRGAKLSAEQDVPLEQTNLELAVSAKELVRLVSRKLSTPKLVNDHSLLQGLLSHLHPALYRLREGMKIHNAMVHQIKNDYKHLFDVIKSTLEEVFPDLNIPDEEIGYLVMHFGSAMNKYQRKQELKALVVCSSGIGSSKMLASRLQREIPFISKIETTSLNELSSIDIDDYDLVVSTISLPKVDQEYFVVNPFLPEKEAEKIKAFVQHLKPETQMIEDHDSRNYVLAHFESYSKTISTIVEVLEQVNIFDENKVNLEELLEELCLKLKKERKIASASKVKTALTEREALGGLGIPGTSIALFHARSEYILRPVFQIIRLEKSIKVKGMDESEHDMRTMLCMLAPLHASQEVVQVLSSISSAIIQDEESFYIFEHGKKQEVFQLLSKIFDDYLKSL
ncbi:BglG family transcription antiterminator [Alteribacter populi]|uniref:BglG family transcription antiterminator n=1 Tax=Alteribacter populi TaxID=2011011 RepID=UPI0018E22D54|nr:PRD domain-containing protein [Alteribacter populi]